ncbi:hypothetical protein M9H77_25475 [Catharanthus roseus]|uniref:Uncharacterized protein n=1 Tax=Catharanthus roseus TaxID=4058 RepID=A0ACC0A6Z9_CATRO|nr:hypothetical protein M9H77_25475 [Catharanthus roseus]
MDKISTKDNPADFGTKDVTTDKFAICRDLLHINAGWLAHEEARAEIPDGGREIGNLPESEFEDDIAELEESFYDPVISIRDEMGIVRLSNLEDAYQIEERALRFGPRRPVSNHFNDTSNQRGSPENCGVRTKNLNSRGRRFAASSTRNPIRTTMGKVNLAEVDEEDVYHEEPKYDQYDDETEDQEVYLFPVDGEGLVRRIMTAPKVEEAEDMKQQIFSVLKSTVEASQPQGRQGTGRRPTSGAEEMRSPGEQRKPTIEALPKKPKDIIQEVLDVKQVNLRRGNLYKHFLINRLGKPASEAIWISEAELKRVDERVFQPQQS